jgi:hypothetical protein
VPSKCHVVSFDDGVRFLGELMTASTLNPAETLSHPLETVVYVERQGAYVRTHGDRLVVTDGEESLLRLSLRRGPPGGLLRPGRAEHPVSARGRPARDRDRAAG